MKVSGLLERKELGWEANGIRMEGTLVVPAGISDGSPGLIFVAGSGPTDRNWCSPLLPGTNGSGKLLAELLASRGYPTFRYDKVASGPHMKENIAVAAGKISMESHAQELSDAISSFISNGYGHGREIYALTNSEGAIHALNYQLSGRKPKFSGFILTGVTGRATGEVAREQIDNQVRMLRNSDEIMKHYDSAIADFLAGRELKEDPVLPEPARMLIRSLATPANLPFSRELWKTSPAELLVKIREKVLVIIGKKDIQVNWMEDGLRLEKLAESRSNITVHFPENADHVLKYQEKKREQLVPQQVGLSYNSEERTLDPETVEIIVKWLQGTL